MDEEKVKNKDADTAASSPSGSDLEDGLEGTFPASDPVSATRRPEKDDKETGED